MEKPNRCLQLDEKVSAVFVRLRLRVREDERDVSNTLSEKSTNCCSNLPCLTHKWGMIEMTMPIESGAGSSSSLASLELARAGIPCDLAQSPSSSATAVDDPQRPAGHRELLGKQEGKAVGAGKHIITSRADKVEQAWVLRDRGRAHAAEPCCEPGKAPQHTLQISQLCFLAGGRPIA